MSMKMLNHLIRNCAVVSPGYFAGTTAGHIYSGRTILCIPFFIVILLSIVLRTCIAAEKCCVKTKGIGNL